MKNRRIIVYNPNINFTHSDSTGKFPPIQDDKRLKGRGASGLAKHDGGLEPFRPEASKNYQDADFTFVTDASIPPIPPSPSTPPKPKTKPVGIKSGYMVGIIAIALAICLDLILLGWLEPDSNVPTTAKNLSARGKELAQWKDQGYQEVEYRRLGFNEVYSHTITSEVDFALVGPPTFMYKDNLYLLTETRMNPADFTRYRETIKISLNRNFTFTVRSLANNSEVSVLYKKSNGVDPLASLTKGVAAISQGVSGLINSVVRAILIIILIILFAIELWIIILALSGQADKPLRSRGSKPEPSILEKLFGPKKATAKNYS